MPALHSEYTFYTIVSASKSIGCELGILVFVRVVSPQVARLWGGK